MTVKPSPRGLNRVLKTSRDLQRVLSPLAGVPAWGARVSRGLLSLEFGPATPIVKTRGEWHLALISGAWRIEKKGKVIAWSNEQDRESLARVARRHLSRRFEKLEFRSADFGAAFRFEGDVVLRHFPTRDEYSWWLFAPPDLRLVVGPGAKMTLQNSSMPTP